MPCMSSTIIIQLAFFVSFFLSCALATRNTKKNLVYFIIHVAIKSSLNSSAFVFHSQSGSISSLFSVFFLAHRPTTFLLFYGTFSCSSYQIGLIGHGWRRRRIVDRFHWDWLFRWNGKTMKSLLFVFCVFSLQTNTATNGIVGKIDDAETLDLNRVNLSTMRLLFYPYDVSW